MLTLNALRRWYIILASLTTLAATQAIFFPRWPTAIPLNQAVLDQQIKSVIQTAKLLPSKPPTRSYDLASSAQLIWQLSDGEVLSLMQVTSRELANFQTAFLTRADPSLKMKNRVIVSSPFPLASGRQQGRSILQTCILKGSEGQHSVAVTGSQLGNARSQLSSGTMRRLKEFLGLSRTPANSCMLVTLTSAASQSKSDTLLFANVVQTILRSSASGEHSSHRSG